MNAMDEESVSNLQFYIIDFGMSIMKAGGTWLYDKENSCKSKSKSAPNITHDLHFVNKHSRFGGDLTQMCLHARSLFRRIYFGMPDSWWVTDALDAVDGEIYRFKQGELPNSEKTYTFKHHQKYPLESNPKHWHAYADRFYYKTFDRFKPEEVLKQYAASAAAGSNEMNSSAWSGTGASGTGASSAAAASGFYASALSSHHENKQIDLYAEVALRGLSLDTRRQFETQHTHTLRQKIRQLLRGEREFVPLVRTGNQVKVLRRRSGSSDDHVSSVEYTVQTCKVATPNPTA